MPDDQSSREPGSKYHRFGDQLLLHLGRKPGLTRYALAKGVELDPAVITKMIRGQLLTGPLARERVLKIIRWFSEQGVLTMRAEADALLVAAGLAGLDRRVDEEQSLIQSLIPDVAPSPPSAAEPKSAEPGLTRDGVSARVYGSAPPLPNLFIGRDEDVRKIKQRLNIRPLGVAPVQALTAVRGWPGVGKTTLAAVLAYDAEIMREFPDGVLWASLGQHPSIFGELGAWGRALGIRMDDVRSIEEASARLAAVLRDKRMLLIVDDVWDVRDVQPFRVGGSHCPLLFTTRLPEVAQNILPPQAIYILGVLSEADALELLRTLAPQVVIENSEASVELVNALEGLPLAIQVAGRLLNAERQLGFGVIELLAEIREGARLIEAQAPADRSEVAQETRPTVAALLKKSTDLLDLETLDCFAYLGAFAPKPATFDTAAMQSVWGVGDAKPMIRTLVDRGLLEPSTDKRFWMHALLVVHARSFLTDDE